MVKIDRNTIKISVIGGNQCNAKVFKTAYEAGKAIAENNAVLVCGGLSGVMEAACKGAKEAGGTTIGILPGDDANTANRYVDIIIPTGMGYARNVLVVKTGHSVIAVDGSFGTLSEIAHALSFGIPVVGLDTWKLEPYCIEEEAAAAEEDRQKIIEAKTPEEAVEIAIKKAKEALRIPF
ncbi:MAG: TIGR00725 family protein [Actinobacteria bacterium]|nr:TIGR00725 family protein [Actinomycetota bacterium]